MLPRISKYLIAVVALAAAAEGTRAQHSLPLHLSSVEWLVGDSDVVVRGTVVDVAADHIWSVVTFDVLETLKGQSAKRVKFVVYKIDSEDAALAQAKQSKRELVWILKRQAAGVPTDAPNREKVLARYKTDLYAPFLPGRPGEPALPVIPLASVESDKMQPPALLTIDLRLLNSSDELVKAIRAAIAETPNDAATGSYSVALPKEVARRTGFSRDRNFLTVPRDGRLEAFARRLVQSPGDFLSKNNGFLSKSNLEQRSMLRLEGVKALRQFPSEKNLAVVRAWLDDPMSTHAFKDEGHALVPPLPKTQQATKVALPADLAHVPEIHFQQPLTKAMKTEDAQLHTAVTIDGVHLLNQKKTDAFIVAMMSKRPDLAGLSFAMGDACRMKPDAGKQFVAALDAFRKAEGSSTSKSEQGTVGKMMEFYDALATEKKIDTSASVASLMQVLGPEEANIRVDLAKYLDGIVNADATRALAKLAIYSAEAEVRTAAVAALKKRDAKDYTEILVAGLKYPWPAVAERSSDAIAKLARKDLLPQLIDVLERPDPRAPQSQEKDGKKVSVVRELVRVNHHHNCLLCHAPATTTRESTSKEDADKLEGLTAQVPVPSESMVAYYRPSSPDILVRFDVTYLRQDFSLKLPVADADPWPEMQRYDFLVRTREVTEKEAHAHRELLQPGVSPYRRAAVSALRELTGQDTEPTAAAWRKLTGL
jgi:hypothetical protein